MATPNISMEKMPSPSARVFSGEAPILGPELGATAEQAANLYERAKARVIDKEAKFEGYVREHPMKSVLVAAGVGAGVGLLVGILVSRR